LAVNNNTALRGGNLYTQSWMIQASGW
jgi:hypothetical protein